MQTYQALEMITDPDNPKRIFHFTKGGSTSGTRPVGYCATENCTHSTPEEASDCFKKWCIEKNDGKYPGAMDMGEIEWGVNLIMYSSY